MNNVSHSGRAASATARAAIKQIIIAVLIIAGVSENVCLRQAAGTSGKQQFSFASLFFFIKNLFRKPRVISHIETGVTGVQFMFHVPRADFSSLTKMHHLD